VPRARAHACARAAPLFGNTSRTGPATRAAAAFAPRRRRNRHDQATQPPPDPLLADAEGECGFVIGKQLTGERTLPSAEGFVLLSPQRLCHHVLVCGATGSGKTETVLRLAYAVAKCSEIPVFYLDGKGDTENAERFVGLMADAGRATRVFPLEPFDGFRGEGHEVHGRLMEVIDYATEGPAAWYRDVAKNVLRLVCDHPQGPPRCSAEVLARMQLEHLRGAHAGASALAAITPQQVSQVRLRYEAFFGQARGALDGGWAWEDATAAYLLLDSVALREEAGGLARFLFEDFAHYFKSRKERERFALLIVDEFSSLAAHSNMAARIEQARGFNTALVLAPQVVAGMGDELEAERILGSVETVVCHRVNTPEPIAALAGTRKAMEYSIHYGEEGMKPRGSARMQHQYKVDPDKVRSLEPGVAYVISRGRAMQVAILRAPQLRAELPAPIKRSRAEHTVPTDESSSEKTELPF
jgi:hypothetical protein